MILPVLVIINLWNRGSPNNGWTVIGIVGRRLVKLVLPLVDPLFGLLLLLLLAIPSGILIPTMVVPSTPRIRLFPVMLVLLLFILILVMRALELFVGLTAPLRTALLLLLLPLDSTLLRKLLLLLLLLLIFAKLNTSSALFRRD